MAKKIERNMSLLDVLQVSKGDSRIKSLAFNFLKTDLDQIKKASQYRKAFSGLMAAQQIFGPQDPGYVQTLNAMRKVLVDYRKVFIEENASLISGEIELLFERILKLIKRSIDQDSYEIIQETFHDITRILKNEKL